MDPTVVGSQAGRCCNFQQWSAVVPKRIQSLMLYHEMSKIAPILHEMVSSPSVRPVVHSRSHKSCGILQSNQFIQSHLTTLPARIFRHNDCLPSPTCARSGCASDDSMVTSAAADSLVLYSKNIAAFISRTFVESQPSDGATRATATSYPNAVVSMLLRRSWTGFVDLTVTPPGLKTSLRWSSVEGRGGETFTEPAAIRLGVSPHDFGLGRK